MWGKKKKKKEEEKAQIKPLCCDQDLNPRIQSPELNVLSIRPQCPALWITELDNFFSMGGIAELNNFISWSNAQLFLTRWNSFSPILALTSMILS